MENRTVSPSRVITHGDGVAWLKEFSLPSRSAVFTSLPDISEMPALNGGTWRNWFIGTVALILQSTSPDSAAIFYQTDIKREGAWIDKSHLCHLGAEVAGARLLWHKIVCRVPAGQVTFGRPAYAHMVAYSRGLTADPGRSTADVLPQLGRMTWSRAMGLHACVAACRFIKEQTTAHTVVDPFCGVGTALAVANAMGLNAVGFEIVRRRADRARRLQVTPLDWKPG